MLFRSLTFSSPVASAEFSKFAGILSEEGIQMVNKHIKSCLTLPGSSVHGSFQARVLEWGAIAFSVLTIREMQIKTIVSIAIHLFKCLKSNGEAK